MLKKIVMHYLSSLKAKKGEDLVKPEVNQKVFNKQYVRDSDVFQSVGDVQKRVN